jgi:hypothetical protein
MIQGWIDSDWVGDQDFHKFTSEYIFLLLGGAIWWQHKNKISIAIPSIEVKYIVFVLTKKNCVTNTSHERPWITSITTSSTHVWQSIMHCSLNDN